MKQKYSWEEAPITTKHQRMRKRLGNNKPLRCPICKEVKKLELSNKDHEYNEDPNDWRYLCHRCHRLYDMEKHNFKFYKKFNFLFT